MENKFTAEQMGRLKACKSVEELIALAKENGTELSQAEATNCFARLNPTNGQLADSELETVSGGCGPEDCSYCNNGTKMKPSCGIRETEEYSCETTIHYFHCKNCDRVLYVE